MISKSFPALEKVCQELGVEIKTEAEVQSIDVHQGRVAGITLADGSSLTAKQVGSSVDCNLTFNRFLESKHLPADFLAAINRIDYSSATAKINVALAEPPNFTCLPSRQIGPQGPMGGNCGPTCTTCDGGCDSGCDSCQGGMGIQRPMVIARLRDRMASAKATTDCGCSTSMGDCGCASSPAPAMGNGLGLGLFEKGPSCTSKGCDGNCGGQCGGPMFTGKVRERLSGVGSKLGSRIGCGMGMAAWAATSAMVATLDSEAASADSAASWVPSRVAENWAAVYTADFAKAAVAVEQAQSHTVSHKAQVLAKFHRTFIRTTPHELLVTS